MPRVGNKRQNKAQHAQQGGAVQGWAAGSKGTLQPQHAQQPSTYAGRAARAALTSSSGIQRVRSPTAKMLPASGRYCAGYHATA